MKPDFEYEANKIVHRSLINSWRSFTKKTLLLKEISEVEIPSLFIFAENDIRPSWSIKQISNLISDSSYIEIEGAGHYIWLSEKDKLGEVLRSFINRFSGLLK